jgi:RNA polymerase sigma-54 factor
MAGCPDPARELVVSMKPTLQLQIGQHLAMTPQLQQAIRLLQLSTLELQQEIQEALDANPMLETADDDGAPSEPVDDTPIDYAAAEASAGQCAHGRGQQP